MSNPGQSNASNTGSGNSGNAGSSRRKEIYKYEANWPIYSINWSLRPDKKYRLAVGSFIEEYNNKIQVISLNEDLGQFVVQTTFDHLYPTTKLMWMPVYDISKPNFQQPDLLASSGDYLRIWRVRNKVEPQNNSGVIGQNQQPVPQGCDVRIECLLNNNKNSDFCAPLTSFDWNEVEPSLIGTSSIDTTCTIWCLETSQVVGRVEAVSGKVRTQLIAHDKEVYDIAFSKSCGGKDIFASVGADGSVRMFDLRHLEHSTIIYEDSGRHALLRLAWNKQDSNYLATFAMDSLEVLVIDIRVPCSPVARLQHHKAAINGLAWAPHSSCHLCTAADDCQALIWDIQQMPRTIEDPILAYTAAGEVNHIQWSQAHPDWIAISFANCLEMLRV